MSEAISPLVAHVENVRNLPEDSVTVSPLSGHTGAEIGGVDLSQPQSQAVIAKIRQALLEWKVVFFRDQPISPRQLVTFGSEFGSVMSASSPMKIHSVQDVPEILIIGKADYPGRGVDSPWHSDLTFLLEPPMGSLLQAIDVPAYGGDTTFSNLAAAYAGLSAPLQRLIDGLWAVHHDRFHANGKSSVHPVVRVHPETGEPLIWVNPNYTDHILGLTNKESRRLLELLYEQISLPAYTARFRWYPGSIAFWDNRASAHVAPTDLSHLGDIPRILHRITIQGERPRSLTGESSYDFGELNRYC
ncbi:TauD/TfdA family dioxygenase [Pseudomonas sp. D5002]|uniref:TauD/TfdA dioxygenase family protein n=1 Tax=Pseudomonas sp. D5002 TaxID=2738818 RepID=UPI0015A34096|nr:TauD/TfdA family dioxygenase [Pseudomonas sp. D5002]NWB09105.1 TauD/TfdA family dioxygenase [Pseudomonas sp. D5002]